MNFAHSSTLFIVRIYDVVAVDFAEVVIADFVFNTRIFHFLKKNLLLPSHKHVFAYNIKM